MSDIHPEQPSFPDAATQFRELATTLEAYENQPAGLPRSVDDGLIVSPSLVHYLGYGQTVDTQDGQRFSLYLRGATTKSELLTELLAERPGKANPVTHSIIANVITSAYHNVHRKLGVVTLGVHANEQFSFGLTNLPESYQLRGETLLAPLGSWVTKGALQQAKLCRDAKADRKTVKFPYVEVTPADLEPLQTFTNDPASHKMFFSFHQNYRKSVDGIVLAR